MGIVSKKPGAEANQQQQPLATMASFGPPPKAGFIQPVTSSRGGPVSNNPLLQGTSSHLSSPSMGPAPPTVGLPPLASSSVSVAALQPSLARPLVPPVAPTYGPPPLSGFVKK